MKEILDRRSIRKFQERLVEKSLIEAVIQAAIKAPSAKNRQPWRFIVVESTEERQKMYQAMAAGIERECTGKALLPNSGRHITDAKHSLEIMKQAPVVIFVMNPKGIPPAGERSTEEDIYQICNIQSIGAAIENLLLEAVSLGLGGLWICNTYFAYEELMNWLQEEGELMAAVALGYPAESPKARPRKPLEEVCCWR